MKEAKKIRKFSHYLPLIMGGFFIIVFLLVFNYFRLEQFSVRTAKALPLANPIAISSTEPLNILTADFNNDNFLDYILATSTDLKIYLNNGSNAYNLASTLNEVVADPSVVLAKDANNDNKLDIVLETPSSPKIYWGNSDGTFSGPINVALGGLDLAFGNYNDDNLLDLAIISAGNITFYSGNGLGNFQFQSTLIWQSGQTAIASADFNHDNLDDLVISGSSIQFYVNTGNFTFTPGSNFATEGVKIIAKDINGDGWADVAVIKLKLSVYINKGDASFVFQGLYSGSTTIWSGPGTAVFSCDYNSDGLVDLGAIFGQKYIYQNLNNPYITYTSPSAAFVGSGNINLKVYGSGFVSNSVVRFDGVNQTTAYVSPFELTAQILAADLSAVGTKDIKVFNPTVGIESLVAFFYIEPNYVDPRSITVGNQPKSGCSADYDNDGIPDLAIVNQSDSNVSILLGHGDGLFINASPATISTSAGPVSVASADFNSDQNNDLAVATSVNGKVSIFLGNGQGGFSFSKELVAGTTPNHLVADDLNNDAISDLIITNSGSGNVIAYLGDGANNYTQTATISTASQPKSTAVGDLNGDGFKDLITANYGANNISVFLGNGLGSFSSATPATVSVGVQPVAAAINDYNNDGLKDVLVVNSGGNTVSILLGIGDGSFTPAAAPTFNTDLKPQDIISQDFNSDGNNDFAVVNYTSNNIVMVLGNGDGSFSAAINYAVGTQPVDLLSADLNNDDSFDLVTVNYGSQNISVLLKKINLNLDLFGTQANYPVGDWPKGLASGDLNNDGKKDLVVTGMASNDVTVYLNSGVGTFTEAAGSPLSVGQAPNIVAIADMNGDSKNDLIVGNRNDTTFTIILGKGDGSFQSSETLSFNIFPFDAVSDDFNNDGYKDFIVTNGSDNTISVILGGGNGNFQNPQNYTTDFWPRVMAKGDFNNDNKLDVATFNKQSNTISILTGNGNGSFNAPTNISASSDISNIISADLNNDNNDDLVLARFIDPMQYPDYPICVMFGCYDPSPPLECSNWACPVLSGNGIFVFLSNGNGTFSASSEYGDLFNSKVLSNGDFNGDNYLDLVGARYDQNKVYILLNNGNGTFTSGANYDIAAGPIFSTVQDFNHDTKLDIAVANQDSKTIAVLFGLGNGTFNNSVNLNIDINPDRISTKDLNNDNNDDLIAGSSGNQAVSVIFNNGDGTFAPAADYISPGQNRSFVIEDFNGDNYQDILTVISLTSNNVGFFLNNGDGTFPTTYNYWLNGFGSSFVTKDFNNDGFYDLVVGLEGATTFKVLLGTGNLSFSQPVDYDAGCNPQYTTSADFNNDENLDLAVSNYCSHTIDVFFGVGDGSFQTPPDEYVIPGQPQPLGIVNVDFNNDDILDLAVTNQYGASVSVLLGIGDGTFSPATFSNIFYTSNDQINGDYNLDGRQDLAVLSYNGYLSILLGNGDSTFKTPIDYYVAQHPDGVITDDFNNDGSPDLAVSNSTETGIYNVSIFLGQVASPARYGSNVSYYPPAPLNLECASTDSQSLNWKFDYAINTIGFYLYDQADELVKTVTNGATGLEYITESELAPNTKYERYVVGFNNFGQSAPTNNAACYTLANRPKAPFITPISMGINIAINKSDGNPDYTEYAIYEYNSNKYVQPDGTLGTEASWSTYENWGGVAGIDLTVSGSNQFYILARNGDGKISGFSAASLNLDCKAISSSEISWLMKAPLGSELNGFNLYKEEGEGLSLVTSIASNVKQNDYNENELQPNSQYSRLFKTYKIISDQKVESEASNISTCYTLANKPLPIIIGEVTDNSIQIIINPNDGNPPETLYAIYETKSGKYVQADGSLGDSPVWLTYSQWEKVEGLIIIDLSSTVSSSGQFRISMQMALNPADYNFVAEVKNGDGVLSEEKQLVTISASKNVAINLAKSQSVSGISKVASAADGYLELPVALRLSQELSILLNIILIILIILLLFSLRETFKILEIKEKLSGKMKILLDMLLSRPVAIFDRQAIKNSDGTYLKSYEKYKKLHLYSQKTLQRTAGVIILKVVILVAISFTLASLQYRIIAQEDTYNQDGQPINAGDQLSYIVRFNNQGNLSANNVKVSDILDSNLTYLADTAKVYKSGVEIPDSCSFSRNVISCSVNDLAGQQSGYLIFKALVNINAVNVTISNKADISGDNFEIFSTNQVNNTIGEAFIMEAPVDEIQSGEESKSKTETTPSAGALNLPPNAVSDTVETFLNQQIEIAVLANDSDPENDLNLNSLAISSGPANGFITIDLINSKIVYTPNQDYLGVDNFTYRICDNGGQCSTASVTVKVTSRELSIAMIGSLFRIFTQDISKTGTAQNILGAIAENETIKSIVESAPVKFTQEKILNNPVVEQVSQNVVTPTLVTVSVINTVPAVATVTMNFWAYLHFLFLEPLLLIFRKKRKNWGVVYASLTKIPLSLALVRLYRKEDKKLVQTKVTDLAGRYLLMVKDPGTYYLEVVKPEYDFPSKLLASDKQDTKYLDLYHGEEIEVKEKDAAVSVNIPLDVREKKVRPLREVIRNFSLKHLKLLISYVGLILAVFVLIIYPSLITIIALLAHIIFYMTFKKLLVPPKTKGWGVVYDSKSKEPLNNTVVRIFDLKFNKLLETQVTDNKGRYAFLVSKNIYQLMAEKEGYQPREIKPVDLIKQEEIVNLDIELVKI